MSTNGQKKSVEEMIQEAVDRATTGLLSDVNLKIQKAFEIGAEIGAIKGAEVGAQAARRAMEAERKKSKKAIHDRRLRNTKLLLRNYRSLNAHFTNAVWTEEDELRDRYDHLGSFEEIMWLMDSRGRDDGAVVNSILKSARVTRIIMQHVNVMLEEYRRRCMESHNAEEARHWRVIEAMYISEEQAQPEDVAAKEGIHERTVYKDVDAAATDLSVLLFGIEGLDRQ